MNFTVNINKRYSQNGLMYKEVELKKIINDFKNCQSMIELMSNQLEELSSIIDYFKWPEKVIKNFIYIF